MSIFKSTLNPIIAAQLKARESVISQWGKSGDTFKAGITPRDDNFLRYTAGKNAWVRMTSFVNYESKVFRKGEWVSDGRYKGDQLSKKYVLEGGTLYNNDFLRSGVAKTGGSYASDIDKIKFDPKSNTVDRLYGYRPMPGIESANIINISAYGSLREATVNFYAWDRHQLEELEILFMRPGYTVLLEWGWSQYLKHDAAKSINSIPDNIRMENFTTGINAFENWTEEAIYDRIDELVEDYKGNYDAMFGFVKNFSWRLMPNGGFQCMTTLISRGEALETLKASSNPNIIIGSKDNQLNTQTDDSQPVLSFFEKIFLNLIGYINDSEITAKQGQLNTSTQNPDGTPNNMTAEQIQSVRDNVTKVGTDIIEKVKKMRLKRWDNGSVEEIIGLDLRNEGFFIKPVDGGPNGSGIEYITLDSFIAILNTFFIFINEKAKKEGGETNVIDIILPYKTPFLISEDTVSVDPTTCLLYNPNATFVTDSAEGFKPELFSIWQTTPDGKIIYDRFDSIPAIQLNDKNNLGALGNILISVQKIIDTYRNLYDPSNGVSIIDLLENILESINLSLGGINNFKLYSSRNIVQIIDAQYLEEGKNDKFNFDLIGLKSLCRDVRINSRIFSEQSSMIAIGAASEGNLGDIYSSTQAAFNTGLKDRVISTIKYNNNDGEFKLGDQTITGSLAYYYQSASNVLSLTNHIKYKVLGVNTFQGKSVDFKVTRVPESDEVVNASSLLKTTQYQINGKDVNYKSLIPFELEIELDGISGFVTGQVFRIEKNILPRDYYNKNLGFIITKQSHNLKGNDWVTTLTTQICLLDNDSIPSGGIDKKKFKETITAILTGLKKSSFLKYAMADYMVYITYKIISTGKNPPVNIDDSYITNQRINTILSKIGQAADPVSFKSYLDNWVKSFQAVKFNGFSSNESIYNKAYRDGITEFSGTELIQYFPKSSDEIALVTGADGSTTVFNFENFARFIFNNEEYKKSITPSPGNLRNAATNEFQTIGTQPIGSNTPQQGQFSFLNYPNINLTINGSTTTLPPVANTSPLSNFLVNFKDSKGWIDPQKLYAYYLKYLVDIYFQQTQQAAFIGAPTDAPISVFWSGGSTNNTNANTEYYNQFWKMNDVKIGTPPPLTSGAAVITGFNTFTPPRN